MRKNLRSLAGLAMFILSAPVAHGLIVIDQLQPVIDFDSGASTAIGGSSEQKLAQTIVVGHSGRLAGVFLPLGCADGVLEIEIQELDGDGKPNGVVLVHQEIEADALPSLLVFNFLRLGSSVSVHPGDRLAIVLQNRSGSCGMAQSPIGDTYLAGEGFFDAAPLGSWSPLTDRLDLPFQVVVRAP